MTNPSDSPLAQAVDHWAHTTQGIADAALETTWVWRAHDDEGVRFAFFRVYEDLRTLAANLAVERAGAGIPVTAAHRALAQYHAAWRDLEAVLVGVSEDLMDQPPAEGEWPLRRILGHMFATPRMFFCQTAYALAEHRAGRRIEHPMPDDQVEPFLGHTWDEDYEEMMGGTRASILADYAAMHARILRELADVADGELSVPTLWWEGYEVPVQFRLHRFDSHMRQHTIQIEKTLAALGLAPNEAKRLNRHIYNALAECEGLHIGAWELGDPLMDHTAASIRALAAEVATTVA